MTNIIDEISRRTYRYYYEDGLVEMAVGGLFTFIGLALLAFERFLIGSSWAWISGLALFAITFGGTYGVKWAVNTLKRRVTHPRTGVVTYKDQPNSGRWLLVAVTALFVIIGFFLPEKYMAMPMVEGVLLTLILVYMGSRVSLRRMQAAAVFPLAVGVLAAYAELGDLMGSVMVFSLTGIALVLFGAVALARYLRNNPLQEES